MDSFESLHYINEWGPLLSEAGDLVSVPDMVRWQMLAPLPLVPAMNLVLDAIERDGSVTGYITNPGNWAVPIPSDWVWPNLRDKRITLPSIRRPGTLGLVDIVRTVWRQYPTEDALYTKVSRSGQFAILLTDAQRLFGWETANPANLKTAHAVIQSDPNPAPAVDLKPTKKPGDDWTPADYAELLRQYESLTTGKGAMKGESARDALGKAWSYAPNSIKPFLTTARKQRNPTT